MDNFTKSANQIWKESNTTLSFKNWLDREKEKGKFIPNKKFTEINDIDSTQIDRTIEDANKKALDSLVMDSNKFEDIVGTTKKNMEYRDANKFIGLNKWVLISSLLLIGGAVGYKMYKKYK